MIAIPESFRAFTFQTGAERILQAYRASVTTMEDAHRKAEKARADYEASGEDDSVYDDDRILTHSTLAELNWAELDATIGISVVREAFIISAFHYWERSARGWTNLHGKKDTYHILRNACAKLYSLHANLDDLNRLNNLLKHSGNARTVSFTKQRFKPPVSHEDVEEAFAIVKSSGPAYVG